jgi:hypothetical protein
MNNQLKPSPRKQGIFGEIIDFACKNKKWWLMPLIVVFLLFGALLFLSSSGSAPFIYKRF